MQFADFSPSPAPSLPLQKDALQKGLGRAVQWATTGALSEDALLDASLHDQRFDAMFEENRGAWLWEIMEAAGTVEGFRDPILQALKRVDSERDAAQLCDLAFHYARRGDRQLKMTLYEFVERKPFADALWIGEGQLLELEGEEAFRLIARVRGSSLQSREWDWDDGAIVDRAIEQFGESRVVQLLDDSPDPAVHRFAACWREQQRQSVHAPRESHSERMRAITLDEILSAAESGQQGAFRGWGIRAEASDLEVVMQRLWAAQAPNVLVNLLKVFSKRPLPQFDERLIELCLHPEEEVRRWAFNAAENVTHPRIREFALAQLSQPWSERSVIGLFTKNYAPGDESHILQSAELPDDPCLRHWMLMDVLDVLEENAGADGSQLALIVYAQTPCAMCRFRAVERLAAQRVAPDWLLEECRYDSNEDCREFAQEFRQGDNAG